MPLIDPVSPPRRKASLLIAEGLPFYRPLFGAMLARQGYAVLEANVQEVAQVAASERPDIIIIDMDAGNDGGEGSGWSAVEELRASPVTAPIPLVVLASGHQRDLLGFADALRVEELLIKPAFPREVNYVVGRLLSAAGRGRGEE